MQVLYRDKTQKLQSFFEALTVRVGLLKTVYRPRQTYNPWSSRILLASCYREVFTAAL